MYLVEVADAAPVIRHRVAEKNVWYGVQGGHLESRYRRTSISGTKRKHR
jgi:hypothetical protein